MMFGAGDEDAKQFREDDAAVSAPLRERGPYRHN